MFKTPTKEVKTNYPLRALLDTIKFPAVTENSKERWQI